MRSGKQRRARGQAYPPTEERAHVTAVAAVLFHVVLWNMISWCRVEFNGRTFAVCYGRECCEAKKEHAAMNRFFTSTTLAAALLAVSVGAPAAGGAAAAGGQAPAKSMQAAPATTTTTRTTPPTTLSPAHTTGQPKQSCETTPNTPGNSASAPGSAFNPSGTAGSVYAGEQDVNSRNTASQSQYDVACARSH